MVVSEGSMAARAAMPHRAARRLTPVIVLAVGLAAVAAFGGLGLRVVAAAAGAWLVLNGWRAAGGRERAVRGWIAIGSLVWLVSELGRLLAQLSRQSSFLADLTVAGLAVSATGVYVSAARGRMRPADEAALYLDAVAVFCALAGGVVILGAGFVHEASERAILVHSAFFVAIVAVALLLHVTTRVPLRLAGPWEMLLGLAVMAAAHLGLVSFVEDGPLRMVAHGAIAIGILLGGHGGGRWSAEMADGRAYERTVAWLRGLLPVISTVATGLLVVTLVTHPNFIDDGLRLAAALVLAVAIVSPIARQTLLISDREKVLGRERRLTDELTLAEAQYRAVVERVPGVVYVAEAGQHGRWHFVSTKIEELLGYTAEEWMADSTLWMSRMHPGDRDRMILAEAEGERVEPLGRWEYRLMARDGRVVWVIDDEAVIGRDVDGRATMVQGILIDISDRKDLEDQLRHQALHDPLTGLPNRVLLVDRLSHALVRRGEDGAVAVLFVDLDDFKAINDTLGHAAGDELLALVAERLGGVLRASDTAARLGGDEFAFLLEGASPEVAEEVAHRILAALAEPFEIQGRSATLTASIGVATRVGFVTPHAAGETADELLRDADTAMYAAKSQGKGRVQVFQRGMDAPNVRRRQLRNSLERAFERDELFLEYQPIIDMRDGALLGLESLVRWNHPQLGRLTPADFVPLAEETNLIAPLGAWVMRAACSQVAGESTIVSVNVSAHQIRERELSALVRGTLRETGLPAHRLFIELTESTLASAGAGAEDELQRVHDLGVRIALDDFGSGYNSLEYLGRLPVDILKIDMSLVERVHLEPQRQEVLRAIGHIAEKLEMEIIVEGVEHEAQRAVLLNLGFVQAQGFLFAPALPLAEALAGHHPPQSIQIRARRAS
jgi:diguanylate cyclase (GGDEF)-like protein/PAS domain S-box-containing protein